MQNVEQHPGIVSAIEFFGSQAKTVEMIGCSSQQSISRYLNREAEPSPEVAVAIHKASDGKVPKWLIRPDLFENPAQAVVEVA